MYHRNKQNLPQHQPNIPTNISQHVENLLFGMDSNTSPDNTVWVPDNYDDIQLASHELDDIMNEADPNQNFPRHPTHSAPISSTPNIPHFPMRTAPSQASHSDIHPKEELQQISTTSRPQSAHPPLTLTPHTSNSQRLPPQPPTSHMSPLRTHHHRIILPHHQFHHSTPPHGVMPHTLAVSQQISPVDLNQAFSLPQTIAGTFPTKQEPSLPPPIPHYFSSSEHEAVPNVLPYHSPQQVLPLQTDPRALDRDSYVRRSAFKADQAKLVHRTQLKQEQRQKEADAEARGSPLTAKDKERERSRRESAVTRKRAEVYIAELERVSRRLPEVEHKLRLAEAELQRMRNTISDFEQQTRQQSHQMNAMLAVSRQIEVKSEPSLTLSPNSERTTNVMNRMQQLDLRLPNTSEAG